MLPPVKVHKIIQNKTGPKARAVRIENLAKELEVDVAVIHEALRVLTTLQLVEANDEVVRLTATGRLANL